MRLNRGELAPFSAVLENENRRSRREFLATGLLAAAAPLGGSGGTAVGLSENKFSLSEGASLQDPKEWDEIRRQFLFAPGTIYLNNASLGSAPGPVVEAVQQGYRRVSEDPTSAKVELTHVIDNQTRPGLAKLLGVTADEIALTRNASEGLKLISEGVSLEPGDEVLTTSHEHPAGINPWLLQAKLRGIAVKEVRVPSPLTEKGEVVEILQKEISARTRVLFFCHVTRGGLLYPAKELCAMARQHGLISAIDGAQAVGMMPVDLRNLDCDLYAASLHKWVLAPMGSGFLYVRKPFQQKFFPFLLHDTFPAARNYELIGTFSAPVLAAVTSAVEFISRIGPERIQSRNRMLSDYLKVQLEETRRTRLVSSRSEEVSACGTTLFEVEGRGGVDIRAEFQMRNISVDDHVRDGHDAVRVSTHFYNNKIEINALLGVLRQVINRD